MTGHRRWTLQISADLPEGADAADFPILARLEDWIRSSVTVTERVRIDTFTVDPGAIHSYLVSAVDFHRLQPDGSCFCEWQPTGGQSHAEHVAVIFEESTRAHAVM